MPVQPLPPKAIEDQTLINRSAGVLSAPVHDEIVMMDIKSGYYFGLDDIGSEIWRRLETPRSFAALVDSLAAEYDADRPVIADDVRKLLYVMAEHKIVTLVDPQNPMIDPMPTDDPVALIEWGKRNIQKE